MGNRVRGGPLRGFNSTVTYREGTSREGGLWLRYTDALEFQTGGGRKNDENAAKMYEASALKFTSGPLTTHLKNTGRMQEVSKSRVKEAEPRHGEKKMKKTTKKYIKTNWSTGRAPRNRRKGGRVTKAGKENNCSGGLVREPDHGLGGSEVHAGMLVCKHLGIKELGELVWGAGSEERISEACVGPTKSRHPRI